MTNDEVIAPLETNSAVAKVYNPTIWLVKALLRSCFWHWIGIPLVAFGLKIIHFWRRRKHGIPAPEPVLLWSDK